MSTTLSEKARAFLNERRFAVLATINEDGSPQLTAMWYLLEGDFIVMNTKENQYRFTLQPHQLTDYTEMCHYHQTSSDSTFTKRRVCTLMTRNGRVTLSDMKLVTTVNGIKEERVLLTDEEYKLALREYFGIIL